MLPDDAKLRIHVIDQLGTDFVMAKNTAMFSVANTINKIHIQINLHLLYQQDFYKYKQKEIYKLLIEYISPSWTILIILRRLNNGNKILMLLLMKKFKPRCKATIKEEIFIVTIKLNTGQQA